jgi:hypothetical protein
MEARGPCRTIGCRLPTASGPTANVVDVAWVAMDWTLSRAMRTARFWWIAAGYLCDMFAWYAVQVQSFGEQRPKTLEPQTGAMCR